MCGIAGIWLRAGEPVERHALESMAASLVHRGPDGYGIHVAGPIGLANQRLRVLDPSERADQPMGSSDGRLWLTFNGEIHNYVELREELRGRGAHFCTDGDTEVVLHAYASWGSECFERFNGMWALALWDARSEQLVLSRDRFGIKPLCYSVRGERVCFASEPKAIIAAFPEERRPDRRELDHFLAGGFPDSSEATFFAGIKSVEPATTIVVSRKGSRSSRYWRFEPGSESPTAGAEERFRELLSDSVRLRTRSDVPVGASLSGGLDSSSIVTLLDPRQARGMPCFSTTFDDPRFDESRYAALLARRLRLQIHWVRPEPGTILDTLRAIVWHHDGPVPIRGRIAQWFVMREASRHVTVLLDGQGGDELLAGYAHDPLYYLIDLVRARCRPGPRALARELAALAAVGGSRRWFVAGAPRRYRRDPRAHGPRPFESMLNNVLWNGVARYGLREILHGEDALGMAFSLETRTPFLDHRLVEFCFSLPFTEKISAGWTKSLLRRSMAELLPPEILARRLKVGFGSPLVTWLRGEENWRGVRELLLDPRTAQRGLLAPQRIRRVLRLFATLPLRWRINLVNPMCRLITVELWFRDFIDAASPSPPASSPAAALSSARSPSTAGRRPPLAASAVHPWR